MKPQLKWAIALLAALLLAAGVMNRLAARKAGQQALVASSSSAASDAGRVELAATDVTQAALQDMAEALPISGVLKAVNSAVIKARVAGELQDLSVREGDAVKAGQVIARIEAADYQSRLRQAREQAASSKAQVDVAQRQYGNNQALVDQGFISRTALDTSRANLSAAQSTYQAALAGAEVAAKAIEDTVLRSPIAGQVSQRLAQPGERVGIDSRIVEVVDLSRLELEASLGAQESMTVRIGQAARLQIEGSPQTVTARVARINPSAQAGSRSVLVYLSIDNTGAAASAANTASAASAANALPLRQGLFAQGTLAAAQARLLAVPLGSVRTDKPQPYVQTVEDGKVRWRPVELPAPAMRGTPGGETLAAVTGLAEGTVVIRGNVGLLREGASVRFTPMAAPVPVPVTAAVPAPGMPAPAAKPAP